MLCAASHLQHASVLGGDNVFEHLVEHGSGGSSVGCLVPGVQITGLLCHKVFRSC